MINGIWENNKRVHLQQEVFYNKKIDELEAKLKEEQERRFTIMKQTIKKIFDDIWRKYIENADLGGDCLSFSEDVFIPCKKKWVGKK